MHETLRERSRARRRAAIEHAALRLFAERGYDATTVAQVADADEAFDVANRLFKVVDTASADKRRAVG